MQTEVKINQNSEKGFTLVELSIVLVIIGLLIGGVLVAQSLINTAKIQSFVRQISQFDVAVATFQQRYGKLPGDDSKIYSGGDNDGLVEFDSGDTEIFAGEVLNFWPSLSITGLKAEESPDTGYSSTFSAINFPYGGPNGPKALLGATTGVLAMGLSTSTIFNSTVALNTYLIADCTGSSADNALSCINGMNGADGIAVDVKIDDGVATSGRMAATNMGSASTNIADLYGATAEAYVASNDSPSATAGYVVFIQIGTTLGYPQ